jgi:hypothetical protein
MAEMYEPLRVVVDPGPQPVRLVPRKAAGVAGNRTEICSGLQTDRERVLVYAVVGALECLAEKGGPGLRRGPGGMAASVLLRAFADATGVNYVGCAWDTDG